MARGVIFPGQGAQHVGMGADVAAAHPVARAAFDEASEAIGVDLARLAFEGPEDELNRTDIAQPAILVSSVAILRAAGATSEGVEFTAGLSMGEYTALVFAGSLEFLDAVRLVRRRGELMQAASDAHPSTMVATRGLDRDQAEALCDRARGDGVLAVANLNAPGQIVVSGDVDCCDRLEKIASDEALGRTVRLQVAGAFHSDRMRPAAEGLAAALADVDIRSPGIPFASNVTADFVKEPAEIRRLLAEQLCSPVLWQASMEHAARAGITQMEEFGPGRVLSGLMRRIDRNVKVTSRNDAASIA